MIRELEIVLFILGVKEGTRKHLYRLVGGLGKVFNIGDGYEDNKYKFR